MLPSSDGKASRVEASFRRQPFSKARGPSDGTLSRFDARFQYRHGKIYVGRGIWNYAAANGFVILTADADFVHLSKKRGAPPKVVRLENCNYKTALVEELLRSNAIRITELEHSGRELLIL